MSTRAQQYDARVLRRDGGRSKGLEAAVPLTESGSVLAQDLAAIVELSGAGVVVRVGDPRGALRNQLDTRRE